MNPDPIDELAARLLVAARKESPSEATRQRITAALHKQTRAGLVSRQSRFSRSGLPYVLAAAVFSVFVLLFIKRHTDPVEISAEPLVIDRATQETATATDIRTAPAADDSAEKARAEHDLTKVPPTDAALPRPSRPSQLRVPPTTSRSAEKPASLDQELAGIERVRAAIERGDPSTALAELDRFSRSGGFRRLPAEADLLRIEALAQAGNTKESRAAAQRFVKEHPNNPLVNRAEKFARPAGSSGSNQTVSTERE